MREKIINIANDLLMNLNIICNYVFVQNGTETYVKNISAIDAYIKAYEMSVNGDIECFIAVSGKDKAVDPVFKVINGVPNFSGYNIN